MSPFATVQPCLYDPTFNRFNMACDGQTDRHMTTAYIAPA